MDILVLVGPSGSGKTTIAEELVKRTSFKKLPTCTTRAPRQGEVNGVHYFFLTEEQFKSKILSGEIVEWTVYAGNYYGTSSQVLSKSISEGNRIVLVMDFNGAKAIKKLFPYAKTVYLDREYKELVMAILERNIPNTDKAERIVQLKEDVTHKDKCDFVLKNDILEDAVNEAIAIAENKH